MRSESSTTIEVEKRWKALMKHYTAIAHQWTQEFETKQSTIHNSGFSIYHKTK